MITPTQNIPINIEVAVLDNTGKFETGLTVDYEVRKVSDNSMLTSGTCTETNGVYHFTYTFTVVEEYRLQWITPVGYEDGFESIVVQNSIQTELTTYDTSKTLTVKTEIQQSTDTIISEIQKNVVVQQPTERSRPYKW